MTKDYLQIIKPGIIFGNLIAASGGFLMASQGHYDFIIFLALMLGTSLVIASACITNNYLDQDIDRLMTRTQSRFLVQHQVSLQWVSVHILLTGLSGFCILYIYTSPLSAGLAIAGYLIYTVIYTLWLKRKSPVSTIVGSLSGALPPAIGYCSVTHAWNEGTSLLFLLFCLWQMPHHYAITIFRLSDYQSAKIPVLPAIIGINRTFTRCIVYIILFSIVSASLYWTGFTSCDYFAITLIINIWWLYTAIKRRNSIKKAKMLFMQSILIIMLHCVLMGSSKNLSLFCNFI